MKKIEIVEKEIEEAQIVVKLTEQDLLDMISEDGLLSVLKYYEIPESFILKWGPIRDLDKNIIIQTMTLSEKFIKEAIDIDYFELEDVHGLNMRTYAGLSNKFTKLYENYINWERMILYLCSSEKIDDISKYEWVIEKFNLWKLISANQLPIDFIRKNRNKLDWRIVSIINNFTDEEKDEFVEDIPNYKEEWDKFKEESNFKIPPSIQNENLTIKNIRTLIENSIVEEDTITSMTENKRFEVKHTMDKISDEDLLQIKEIIRSNQNMGW